MANKATSGNDEEPSAAEEYAAATEPVAEAPIDAAAPAADEVGAPSPESSAPTEAELPPEPAPAVDTSPSDLAVPPSVGVPVADILPPVASIDAGFGVHVDAGGNASLAPVPVNQKLATMTATELEANIRSYEGSDLGDFHELSTDELRVYAALLAAASAVPIPLDRFPSTVGAWLTLYRINKVQAEAEAAVGE